MLADGGGFDLVGEAESGIEADAGILGRHVFLDEQLQREVRDFDAVDRDRVHVHVSVVVEAGGFGVDDDVVHAGEKTEQRIRIAASGFDLVEVDARLARDRAGRAGHANGFDAGGKLDASGGEVGVDLILGELGGVGVGMRLLSVAVDVVEFVGGAVGESVGSGGEEKGRKRDEEEAGGGFHV